MSDKIFVQHPVTGKRYVLSERAGEFYRGIRQSLEAAGLPADVAVERALDAVFQAAESGVLLKAHKPREWVPSFADLVQDAVNAQIDAKDGAVYDAWAAWLEIKAKLEQAASAAMKSGDFTAKYSGKANDAYQFTFEVPVGHPLGELAEKASTAGLEIKAAATALADDLWKDPKTHEILGTDKPGDVPPIGTKPTTEGVQITGAVQRKGGGSGNRFAYKIEKDDDGVTTVYVNGQLISSGRTRDEVEAPLKAFLESQGKDFYSSQFRRKPEWPTE